MTLNQQLGQTQHHSPLARKLKRLGLTTSEDLEVIASRRGAYHYPVAPDLLASCPAISEKDLPTEELITSLLLGNHPYRPQLVRIAAQLLATPGLNPERLAQLAIQERCHLTLRHILTSAATLPHPPPLTQFWEQLDTHLKKLSSEHPQRPYDPATGILPHPSRFTADTGYRRGNRDSSSPPRWLAPSIN